LSSLGKDIVRHVAKERHMAQGGNIRSIDEESWGSFGHRRKHNPFRQSDHGSNDHDSENHHSTGQDAIAHYALGGSIFGGLKKALSGVAKLFGFGKAEQPPPLVAEPLPEESITPLPIPRPDFGAIGEGKESESSVTGFLAGAPYSEFRSSNVADAKYNYRDMSLDLGFLNGGKYRYYDVSPYEAKSFYSAPSKGKWVWDKLRLRGTVFGYQKPYSYLSGDSEGYMPKYYSNPTHREELRNIGPEGETPISWREGYGPYGKIFKSGISPWGMSPEEIETAPGYRGRHMAEGGVLFTPEESQAQKNYEAGPHFAFINQQLRAGIPIEKIESYGEFPQKEVMETIEGMDSSIAKSPVIEFKKLHRGTTLNIKEHPKIFTVGETFTDNGYVSTTPLGPQLAKDFQYGEIGDFKDVMFHIDVPKGTKGLSLSQEEIVLPRGNLFKVNSISQDEKGRYQIGVALLGGKEEEKEESHASHGGGNTAGFIVNKEATRKHKDLIQQIIGTQTAPEKSDEGQVFSGSGIIEHISGTPGSDNEPVTVGSSPLLTESGEAVIIGDAYEQNKGLLNAINSGAIDKMREGVHFANGGEIEKEEKIVQAGFRFSGDKIIGTGPYHDISALPDEFKKHVRMVGSRYEDGFITNLGRFMNREEASRFVGAEEESLKSADIFHKASGGNILDQDYRTTALGGTYYGRRQRLPNNPPDDGSHMADGGETDKDYSDLAQELTGKAISNTKRDVPGQPIECHIATHLAASYLTASGDPAKSVTKVYNWDESKGKELSEKISLPDIKGVEWHAGIRNLVEDLRDESVNGHSFMVIGNSIVDPHLADQGVPSSQINAFGKHLAEIYKGIGIKPEPLAEHKAEGGKTSRQDVDDAISKIQESVPELKYAKVYTSKYRTGYGVSLSDTIAGKTPQTIPGHETATGMALGIDPENKHIHFTEMTSKIKGAGTRMVDAVAEHFPEHSFSVLDWSGEEGRERPTFWDKMKERHPERFAKKEHKAVGGPIDSQDYYAEDVRESGRELVAWTKERFGPKTATAVAMSGVMGWSAMALLSLFGLPPLAQGQQVGTESRAASELYRRWKGGESIDVSKSTDELIDEIEGNEPEHKAEGGDIEDNPRKWLVHRKRLRYTDDDKTFPEAKERGPFQMARFIRKAVDKDKALFHESVEEPDWEGLAKQLRIGGLPKHEVEGFAEKLWAEDPIQKLSKGGVSQPTPRHMARGGAVPHMAGGGISGYAFSPNLIAHALDKSRYEPAKSEEQKELTELAIVHPMAKETWSRQAAHYEREGKQITEFQPVSVDTIYPSTWRHVAKLSDGSLVYADFDDLPEDSGPAITKMHFEKMIQEKNAEAMKKKESGEGEKLLGFAEEIRRVVAGHSDEKTLEDIPEMVGSVPKGEFLESAKEFTARTPRFIGMGGTQPIHRTYGFMEPDAVGIHEDFQDAVDTAFGDLPEGYEDFGGSGTYYHGEENPYEVNFEERGPERFATSEDALSEIHSHIEEMNERHAEEEREREEEEEREREEEEERERQKNSWMGNAEDLPFHSRLELAIGKLGDKPIPVEAVKGRLKDYSKEEWEYVGMDKALEGKKVVTKEELRGHAIRNALNIQEIFAGGRGEPKTVYEDYQTPGGTDYREMVLAMPDSHVGKYNPGPYHAHFDDEDEPNYVENPLVHARFKTRKQNGEKILELMEVQSDLHQEGQGERGYKSQYLNLPVPTELPSGYEVKQSEEGKFYVADPIGNPLPSFYSGATHQPTEDAAKSIGLATLQNKAKEKYTKAIPDFPFKETWHELAMKRVLLYAAQNDFDRVVLAPGELIGAAVSPDLSDDRIESALSQMSEADRERVKAELSPLPGETVAEAYRASSRQNVLGLAQFYGTNYTEEELGAIAYAKMVRAKAAGKELTKQQEALFAGTLSKEKVGKQIKEAQQLPKALAKIGKGFGAKTETFGVEVADDIVPMASLVLSPESRQQIKEKGFYHLARGGAVPHFDKGGQVTTSQNPSSDASTSVAVGLSNWDTGEYENQFWTEPSGSQGENGLPVASEHKAGGGDIAGLTTTDELRGMLGFPKNYGFHEWVKEFHPENLEATFGKVQDDRIWGQMSDSYMGYLNKMKEEIPDNPLMETGLNLKGWRVGPTDNKFGRGVFFGGAREDTKMYESGFPGFETKPYQIQLDKALVAWSQNDVSQHLFGKRWDDLIHKHAKKTKGDEAIANSMVDADVAKKLSKQGYQGLVYMNPFLPAKSEIVAFGPYFKEIEHKADGGIFPKEVLPPAAVEVMEKYKGKEIWNDHIQEFMKSVGLSIDDYHGINKLYYSHNVGSDEKNDQAISSTWNSDSRLGKAMRTFSAWNEWQVQNNPRLKGKEQKFYRKGPFDKTVISMTRNPEGARSGSSHFKPDRSMTLAGMNEKGYSLLAGNVGMIGVTAAQEDEHIFLHPGTPDYDDEALFSQGHSKIYRAALDNRYSRENKPGNLESFAVGRRPDYPKHYPKMAMDANASNFLSNLMKEGVISQKQHDLFLGYEKKPEHKTSGGIPHFASGTQDRETTTKKMTDKLLLSGITPRKDILDILDTLPITSVTAAGYKYWLEKVSSGKYKKISQTSGIKELPKNKDRETANKELSEKLLQIGITPREGILARMSDKSLSVASSLDFLGHDSEESLVAARGPHTNKLPEGRSLAGFYVPGKGEVHLPPRSSLAYSLTDIDDIWTHEVGHALDYNEPMLSGSKAWRTAWEKEIYKLDSISNYAKTSPLEGFAEFFRGAVTGKGSEFGWDNRGVLLKNIQKKYPLSFGFFESAGLLKIAGSAEELESQSKVRQRNEYDHKAAGGIVPHFAKGSEPHGIPAGTPNLFLPEKGGIAEILDSFSGRKRGHLEYDVNPGPAKIKSKLAKATSGLRWIADDKNVVVWDGFSAIHEEMRQALGIGETEGRAGYLSPSGKEGIHASLSELDMPKDDSMDAKYGLFETHPFFARLKDSDFKFSHEGELWGMEEENEPFHPHAEAYHFHMDRPGDDDERYPLGSFAAGGAILHKADGNDATDDFAKWFAGSKVVDEKGRPKRVYHGTLHDFDTFKTDYPGKEYGMADRMLGAHFAEDPSVTSAFTVGAYARLHDYAWDPYNQENSWYRDKGKLVHGSDPKFAAIPVLSRDEQVEPYSYERHGSIYGIREKHGDDAQLSMIRAGGRTIPAYLNIKNPVEVGFDPRGGSDQMSIPAAVGTIAFAKNRQLFIDATGRSGVAKDHAARIWDTWNEGKPFQSGGEYGNYNTLADYMRDSGYTSLNSGDMAIAAKQELKKQGYDGIRYANTSQNEVKKGANPWAWIAFDPAQIRTGPHIHKADGGPTENAPPFYSRLEKAIEGLGNKPVSVEAVKNRLKKSGFSEEEWQYTKMDEALVGKKIVTKEELLGHAQENAIDVQTIIKGGTKDIVSGYGLWITHGPEAGQFVDNPDDGHRYVFSNQSEAEELASEMGNVEARPIPQQIVPATKYSQFQTPGGANYREMLLTLPSPAKAKSLGAFEKFKEEMSVKYGDMHTFRYKATDEEKEQEAKLRNTAGWSHDEFMGAHWNEPNVLAHIRFNDRVGNVKPDGTYEKVLHIEEIQSDWHQKGREKGYKEKPWSETNLPDFIKVEEIEPWDKIVLPKAEAAARLWRVKNTKTGSAMTRQTKENAIRDAFEEDQRNKVPDAPFKESWPELAMKRALHYAAEHGYDRITLNPGEQINKVLGGPDEASLLGQASFYGTNLSAEELGVIADRTRKVTAKGNSPEEIASVAEVERTRIGEKIKATRTLPNIMAKLGKPFGAVVEPYRLKTKDLLPQDEEDLSWLMAEMDALENQDELMDEMDALENQDGPDEGQLDDLQTRMDNITSKYDFKATSLPLTPETRKEILAKGFPKMAKGGVVHHAARGGLLSQHLAGNSSGNNLTTNWGKAVAGDGDWQHNANGTEGFRIPKIGNIEYAGGTNKAQSHDLLHNLFSSEQDEPEVMMAAAMGAPDYSIIKWSGYNKQIMAEAFHPSIKRLERSFQRTDSGKKIIYNQSFKTVEQGTGLGLKTFSSQVDAAKGLGFSKIDTTAIGEGSHYSKSAYSGYYAWARMGYDEELRNSIGQELGKDHPVLKDMKERFPHAKTILDIMETEEGRDWWKVYGRGFVGSFDLSEGSRSMKVLEAYKNEPKQREKLHKIIRGVAGFDEFPKFPAYDSTKHFRKGGEVAEQFLSAEEEKELVIKGQQGDIEARNKVVMGIYPLIQGKAHKIAERTGMDQEDLAQLGFSQVLSAFGSYDPEKGVQPNTYFGTIAENAMRGNRGKESVIRVPRAAFKSEGLQDVVRKATGVGSLNVSARSEAEETGPMVEDPAFSPSRIREEEGRSETMGLLHESIGALPERLQELVRMRMEGETLESIGGKWGISKVRVGQLEKDAHAKLKESLAGAGVAHYAKGGAIHAANGLGSQIFDLEELSKDFDPERFRWNPDLPDETRKWLGTPGLSMGITEAISNYTVGSHHDLNRMLREGQHGFIPWGAENKEELLDLHSRIQSAFFATPEMGMPVPVKRGVDIQDPVSLKEHIQELKKSRMAGKPWIANQYLSTTTDSTQDFGGNVRYHINALRGIDVMPVSEVPEEKELLLPYGDPFQVKKIKKDEYDTWHVFMDQLRKGRHKADGGHIAVAQKNPYQHQADLTYAKIKELKQEGASPERIAWFQSHADRQATQAQEWEQRVASLPMATPPEESLAIQKHYGQLAEREKLGVAEFVIGEDDFLPNETKLGKESGVDFPIQQPDWKSIDAGFNWREEPEFEITEKDFRPDEPLVIQPAKRPVPGRKGEDKSGVGQAWLQYGTELKEVPVKHYVGGGDLSPFEDFASKEELLSESPELYPIDRIKASEPFHYIPKGSKYLGHGVEATAFLSPSNDVFRVQKVHEIFDKPERPNIKSVLQEIASKELQVGDENYLVEQLPYAEPFTKQHDFKNDLENSWSKFAGIRDQIATSLNEQGYEHLDLHPGNIGLHEGEWKVIDPGGLYKKAVPKTQDQLFEEIFGEEHKAIGGPLPEFTLKGRLGGSSNVKKVGIGNQDYALKSFRKNQQAEVEESAESIYKVLGIDVPEASYHETPQGTQKLSKFIKGTSYGELEGKEREAANGKIRRGFVADALLGAWDVIGRYGDNILMDEQGNPIRIDSGSAFDYRAMGAKKPFPPEVTEINTFRDPSINEESAEVFSGITDRDIAEQTGHILKHRDAVLERTPERHREVMGKRMDWLGENYGGVEHKAMGTDKWEQLGYPKESMEYIKHNDLNISQAIEKYVAGHCLNEYLWNNPLSKPNPFDESAKIDKGLQKAFSLTPTFGESLSVRRVVGAGSPMAETVRTDFHLQELKKLHYRKEPFVHHGYVSTTLADPSELFDIDSDEESHELGYSSIIYDIAANKGINPYVADPYKESFGLGYQHELILPKQSQFKILGFDKHESGASIVKMKQLAGGGPIPHHAKGTDKREKQGWASSLFGKLKGMLGFKPIEEDVPWASFPDASDEAGRILQEEMPYAVKQHQMQSYGNAMKGVLANLDEVGIKDIWGTDFHKSPELRNVGVNRPQKFHSWTESTTVHLQQALKHAEDLENEKASELIRQKLSEIHNLKQDIAKFHGISKEGMEIEAKELPEDFGKKGAKAKSLSMAQELFGIGWTKDEIISELRAKRGLELSTATQYVTEAEKSLTKGEGHFASGGIDSQAGTDLEKPFPGMHEVRRPFEDFGEALFEATRPFDPRPAPNIRDIFEQGTKWRDMGLSGKELAKETEKWNERFDWSKAGKEKVQQNPLNILDSSFDVGDGELFTDEIPKAELLSDMGPTDRGVFARGGVIPHYESGSPKTSDLWDSQGNVREIIGGHKIRTLQGNIPPFMWRPKSGPTPELPKLKEYATAEEILEYTKELPNNKRGRARASISSIGHEAFHFLPKGSQWIGSGVEATAFLSPENDVFRIEQEPGKIGRPKVPNILQASAHKLLNAIKSPSGEYVSHYIEKMPYAEMANQIMPLKDESGNPLYENIRQFAGIQSDLTKQLYHHGLYAGDAHSGNVGRHEGQWKLIDPGFVHSLDELSFEERFSLFNLYGEPQHKAKGSKAIPHMRHGGTVQNQFGAIQGSDNQSVLVEKGGFVVNAIASQRYASELDKIQSGTSNHMALGSVQSFGGFGHEMTPIKAEVGERIFDAATAREFRPQLEAINESVKPNAHPRMGFAAGGQIPHKALGETLTHTAMRAAAMSMAKVPTPIVLGSSIADMVGGSPLAMAGGALLGHSLGHMFGDGQSGARPERRIEVTGNPLLDAARILMEAAKDLREAVKGLKDALGIKEPPGFMEKIGSAIKGVIGAVGGSHAVPDIESIIGHLAKNVPLEETRVAAGIPKIPPEESVITEHKFAGLEGIAEKAPIEDPEAESHSLFDAAKSLMEAAAALKEAAAAIAGKGGKEGGVPAMDMSKLSPKPEGMLPFDIGENEHEKAGVGGIESIIAGKKEKGTYNLLPAGEPAGKIGPPPPMVAEPYGPLRPAGMAKSWANETGNVFKKNINTGEYEEKTSAEAAVKTPVSSVRGFFARAAEDVSGVGSAGKSALGALFKGDMAGAATGLAETGNAMGVAAAGPAGAIAGGVMLALEGIDKATKMAAAGVETLGYGAIKAGMAFGELLGVPASVSNLFGSVGAVWVDGISRLVKNASPLERLTNPLGALTDGFESLKNVSVALVQVMLDLRNPAAMLQGAIAPFIQQVGKFNPGIVERFNLAMDNLSAAAGVMFVPIIEGVRDLADVFNRMYGSIAPAVNAALTQLVTELRPLAIEIGGALIPMFRDFVVGIKDLVIAFKPFLEVMVSVTKEVAGFVAGIMQAGASVVSGFGRVSDLVLGGMAGIGVAIVGALSASFAGLVVAFAPLIVAVGAIVAPFVALGAAVVAAGIGVGYLWSKMKEAGATLDPLWAVFSEGKVILGNLWEAAKSIGGAFADIFNTFTGLGQSGPFLKTVFDDTVANLRVFAAAISTVSEVIQAAAWNIANPRQALTGGARQVDVMESFAAAMRRMQMPRDRASPGAAGPFTIAAQQARQVSIEDVGLQARVSSFSMGSSIQEQQLAAQQQLVGIANQQIEALNRAEAVGRDVGAMIRLIHGLLPAQLQAIMAAVGRQFGV